MAFSEFWFGRRAHFYYSCFEDFDSLRHVQISHLHLARLTLGFLSGRLFIPTFPPHGSYRFIVSERFFTGVSTKDEAS